MISDTERREVATWLRLSGDSLALDNCFVRFIRDTAGSDLPTEDFNAASYLANLIDLPVEVVTAARLAYLAKHGVELSVMRGESVRVSRLDNDAGSGIFGGGFLISERAAAERAAAERIALSPREAEIVRALDAS